MEFYLFLSNRNSQSFYPFNSSVAFSVNLLREYNLVGYWKVAITELSYKCKCSDISPKPVIPMYICLSTDICETSFIADQNRSILRKIAILGKTEFNKVFSLPYYFDVTKTRFTNINITVLDEFMNPSVLVGELSFVLHFKRYG